jgi:hypothetical protein
MPQHQELRVRVGEQYAIALKMASKRRIEGASLRYCLISEMDFRVARHPGGIASTPQNHPNCCQYAAMGIDEASYKMDPGESTGGT